MGIVLVPDQVLSEKIPEVDLTKQQRIAKLDEKRQSRIGYDVDKTLRQLFHSGKSPRISILYGNNGIVDSGVMSALRDVESAYLLREVRVSFTDKDMIIARIKKIEDYSDVIAIARGGGSGLEVFDDIDLADAVLDTKVPVIVAIGHDQDNTLVKRIADKAFSTPTAFGNYLREIALEIVEDEKATEGINDNIQKQNVWGLFLVLGALIITGMLLWFFG
jgi:hypothetical protein